MSTPEEELTESHELDYQYTDEAIEILGKLEDCYEDLDNGSQNFVDDMTDRMEKWGDRMYVSERQIEWLRRLEDKHC